MGCSRGQAQPFNLRRGQARLMAQFRQRMILLQDQPDPYADIPVPLVAFQKQTLV